MLRYFRQNIKRKIPCKQDLLLFVCVLYTHSHMIRRNKLQGNDFTVALDEDFIFFVLMTVYSTHFTVLSRVPVKAPHGKTVYILEGGAPEDLKVF